MAGTTNYVYHENYMNNLNNTLIKLERNKSDFIRYVKIEETDYNSKWGWKSGIPGGNGEDDIFIKPKDIEREIDLLKDGEEHYEYLHEKYEGNFDLDDIYNILNIESIYLLCKAGYINFTIKCLIIWFTQILYYFVFISIDSKSIPK